MKVLVIMPVGSDPSYADKREILRRLSKELAVDLDLPLERPSLTAEDYAQSLRPTVEADLVLGDLSLERPSCYFEVGVAQGIGKRTVLIMSSRSVLHQVFERQSVETFAGLDEYEELVRSILLRSMDSG